MFVLTLSSRAGPHCSPCHSHIAPDCSHCRPSGGAGHTLSSNSSSSSSSRPSSSPSSRPQGDRLRFRLQTALEAVSKLNRIFFWRKISNRRLRDYSQSNYIYEKSIIRIIKCHFPLDSNNKSCSIKSFESSQCLSSWLCLVNWERRLESLESQTMTGQTLLYSYLTSSSLLACSSYD